jgi:radical SAM superfamily enzyme YgiQ (UPF0313 family)
MKIAFYVSQVENMGVEMLSSIVKEKGHIAKIFFDPKPFSNEALRIGAWARFFSMTDGILDEILQFRPDILGLSAFTISYPDALEAAKVVKNRLHIPVIMGGVHATSTPETVLAESCIDYVCVGEGIEALPELLATLDQEGDPSGIPNIWLKRNGQIVRTDLRPLFQDFDRLPLPDKTPFYTAQPISKDEYSIITTYGCAYQCTYCVNNLLRRIYQGKGKYLRRRSVANVLGELEWAKREFRPKRVLFCDDYFASDKSWLREFAAGYKGRIRLPFTAVAHPERIDEETASLLKDCGCRYLIMGNQSVNPEIRQDILNRRGRIEDVERAARVCRGMGLKFSLDQLMNVPFDRLENQDDALEFYNRLRPNAVNAYWLQYFPGTEIIDHGIRAGVFDERHVADINRGLASSSMVIGFGRKDQNVMDRMLPLYHFLYSILPLIPQRWMEFLIRRRKAGKLTFVPPAWITILCRFLSNLRERRGYVYIDILRNFFYHARRQLRRRLLGGKKTTHTVNAHVI